MTFKLDYLPFRARGEYIRYIFHHAGVQFEDNVIQPADWPLLKPNTPFGKLPVLYVDGKPLADTLAIGVYLGKEFRLDGANAFEAAKCLSIAATLEATFADFARPIVASLFAGDIEKAAAAYKDKMSTTIVEHLKLFEKVLTDNGGVWFVGSGMTWVDLQMAHFNDALMFTFDPKLLNEYPKLMKHTTRVHELPQIKKYVQNRNKKNPKPFLPMIDKLQKHLACPV